MGPLDGLVVADFSRVLAGPYASMTLGDLGARVIKVERPGSGDDTRAWGPPWSGDQSTYFQALNRNKESIALDFGVEGDRELAASLSERADILIENFRPGTLDRYGLGPRDVMHRNPGIVYCSITAFGDSDDARDVPGYDLLVQAASGLMSITGWPDGAPTKVGVALIDHICALQAVAGILAAIHHRDRTGRGQHVTVSLMGAALSALLNQASGYLGAGVVPRRLGNRHPSIAPYQSFTAADGDFVLACGNDTQFSRVAEVIGQPDLADDPRFHTNDARVRHVDALDAILTRAFSERHSHELITALVERGVPAGPVNDIAEAFALALGLGLPAIDEFTDAAGSTFRSVPSPIGLSETPTTIRSSAPGLGAHDRAIREWLASSDDEVPVRRRRSEA